MFINQELVILGGQDTAAEEAFYLTKYASLIYNPSPSKGNASWWNSAKSNLQPFKHYHLLVE